MQPHATQKQFIKLNEVKEIYSKHHSQPLPSSTPPPDLERGEVNQSPQFEDQHHHDLERVEETRRRQLATISLFILHLTHVPSNDERIVTSRNDGCVICLEDFQLGEDCQAMSMCKHVFHSGCLEEWLVQNQSCPLCRIDLSFSSHLSCSIYHYLGAQHESFM